MCTANISTFKMRHCRLYRDGATREVLSVLWQAWHIDAHGWPSYPAFLKSSHVGCEQWAWQSRNIFYQYSLHKPNNACTEAGSVFIPSYKHRIVLQQNLHTLLQQSSLFYVEAVNVVTVWLIPTILCRVVKAQAFQLSGPYWAKSKVNWAKSFIVLRLYTRCILVRLVTK